MSVDGKGFFSREVFGALVVVALMAALFFTRREATAYRGAAEQAVERASVGVLVGKRLRPAKLPTSAGDTVDLSRAPGSYRFVWLVDPDRCPDCLAEAGAWERMARANGMDAQLILEGVGPARARELVAEHRLRAVVLADSARRASPTRWEHLGSVKLLTDEAGRVVLASGEREGCAWNFEETAVFLRGRSAPVVQAD